MDQLGIPLLQLPQDVGGHRQHLAGVVLQLRHRRGIDGQLIVADEQELQFGQRFGEGDQPLRDQRRRGEHDIATLRRYLAPLSRFERISDDPVGQLLGRQRADVDTVQPIQLLDVEDRPDRADLVPVETVHELLEAGDLLLTGGRRIREQLEEIAQRLGQIALFAEPHQPGGRVLALGDLRLVGIAQQWHVRELGSVPAEP
ncbi:hypothetical protein SDC9_113912 [bioreactor metagenome]|uniref:Uncharacterized protein n=1 Tax=bioreactor metagenome TaxID=1076179 RepID=A0A645BP38_9ZZZZ